MVHKTLFKIQLLTILTTNTGHLARLILFITHNVDKKAYSNQTTCLLVFQYGLTLYGSHGHCTFLVNTVRSTVTFPHDHRRYVTHVNTARFRWEEESGGASVHMGTLRSRWTLFRWTLYGPHGHCSDHMSTARSARSTWALHGLHGPHGHCTVCTVHMGTVRSTWTLFRSALYGPCGHCTVHTGTVRFTRAMYGPHGHCTVHMYIIQIEDVRSTLITLYGH